MPPNLENSYRDDNANEWALKFMTGPKALGRGVPAKANVVGYVTSLPDLAELTLQDIDQNWITSLNLANPYEFFQGLKKMYRVRSKMLLGTDPHTEGGFAEAAFFHLVKEGDNY